MEVVWAGSFVSRFERNKRLAEYLETASISLRVLRVDLWPEDRIAAFSDGRLKIAFRMFYLYPLLFMRLLLARRPDVYLVSYPGWFDIPVVKLVAKIKRRPVVFDVFISLYDTAITDRQLADGGSIIGRLARGADRLSLRMSDRVLADCRSHARFLAELAGIGPDKFGVLYLGADEEVFRPAETRSEENRVVFYGTFVPLQGAESIVRAAAHLESSQVRIRMIGSGQTLAAAQALAEDLELPNVEFLGRMPHHDLVAEIGSATICLGIFGETSKADRVIPHKLYEALACARSVITSDSTAVREVFPDGEVISVSPGDPEALAEAIERLIADDDRRHDLAHSGHERFIRDFALEPQSLRLVAELSKAANR